MGLSERKLIGSRIRTARLKSQISQELLAEQVKCSTGYISNIENGRASVSLDILFSICEFLLIDTYDLIADVGYKKEKPSNLSTFDRYCALEADYKEAIDMMVEKMYSIQQSYQR